MSTFDSLYSTISSYREGIQRDLLSSIGDVEAAIAGWYTTTFPKIGPPKIATAFNKASNDIKLPDDIDFEAVKDSQTKLDQKIAEFNQRYSQVTIPTITIEFDSGSDLTDFTELKSLTNYDPTTKFKTVTFSSLNDLSSSLCSIFESTQQGYANTLDYISQEYTTAVSALDNMYRSVLQSNIANFNPDVDKVKVQAVSDFDYKTRSAILSSVGALQGAEANFVKNVAKLYAKVLKALLERNKQEIALWQEEKELLIKFEWDKYVTTTDGFIQEFTVAVDNLASKAIDNIKAIVSNYQIELGKFETNLKAVDANVSIDIDNNKADLSVYEAQLLDLDVRYKSALQLSRADFLSDMNIANSVMNSLVSSLQTATPTAISLKTQKG